MDIIKPQPHNEYDIVKGIRKRQRSNKKRFRRDNRMNRIRILWTHHPLLFRQSCQSCPSRQSQLLPFFPLASASVWINTKSTDPIFASPAGLRFRDVRRAAS